MAEYRLSPAAESDLENIWRYTQLQWGSDRADHYLDVLVTAFVALAEAPKQFPACDYIRTGYRRSRVERHMIYFRITPYGINIVRVLHDRMDASKHL